MIVPPSRETLGAVAGDRGYDERVLERVARMLALLEAISVDPELTGRYALKGGTALNLFHLDVPRLSVDVDLNFVGSPDREAW
jgi:predicted nucleotidyltransferase component of viral defense system